MNTRLGLRWGLHNDPTMPRFLTALCLTFLLAASAAQAAPLTITEARAVASSADRFPGDQPSQSTPLPDDWSRSRPRYDGGVWYRVPFDPSQALADLPGGSAQDELLSVYIARACGTVDVYLNGHRIASGGGTKEPVARRCLEPQLVTLPAALLRSEGNVLDLRVEGDALPRVSARQRAGSLSALEIGPQQALVATYESQLFWNLEAPRIVAAVLVVIGLFMLGLFRMNRGEVYLMYFGALLIGWAAASARDWWTTPPLDSSTVEFLACCLFPPLAAFAVQFLLSYAGLRSRIIEGGLWLQCFIVPASLLVTGPGNLFLMASAWYVLLAAELFATMALYLVVTRKSRRQDFWPMAVILGSAALIIIVELLPVPDWPVLTYGIPLLLVAISARLLQLFALALQSAEAGRSTLEVRVKEATAEIERNFAQLSELRVEQVTEKERKRIAADLHDDLGAKLLTIVHTSESDRISTLAREALEEMRLSVRGLTGRPVRLADALADWRAEVVMRLGQANVESDWQGPAEEVEHLLTARAYVQTTRIFREAVSNIIKHSGASLCQVRSHVGEREFGVTIQDNGKGIPMELDGQLDRGHGMSSMKHRAKQLSGQCLVESGPGYGTVIRLTLPL